MMASSTKAVLGCWASLAVAACQTSPATNPGMTASEPTNSPQAAAVWPDEDFRHEQPPAAPPRDLQIPPIERFEVAGVDVYLVHREIVPTVTMSLRFPVGGFMDPAEKRGLAGICASLMDEGTEALDKIAFEERKADLASNVWAFSSSESFGVGMSTLRRNLEPTVDLMVDVLRKPGLRSKDLERLRSRRHASLTQAKAAVGSLGRRLWSSVVYGPNHPYGRVTTPKSLDEIGLADCRNLLASLSLRGARLFVAGAISKQEVISLLEPRFAGFGSRGGKGLPTVPPPSPRRGTIFASDIPGAAQSQIYVGHPGPFRDAPGFEALQMVGAILGGSFSGRVNMNIREDKGYAYGARANFSYRKRAGSFSARSSVRSDATEAAVRELHREITLMREETVQIAELQREQDGALLRLPARFSTAQKILNTYSNLVFFDLPLDYYQQYPQRLRAVDVAAVRQAAVRYLQASDFKVLVVGDLATIRSGLQALANEKILGDEGLVVLDGDGQILKEP